MLFLCYIDISNEMYKSIENIFFVCYAVFRIINHANEVKWSTSFFFIFIILSYIFFRKKKEVKAEMLYS